jgi:hypothetical protein
MARPTKLTAKLTREITSYIQEGNTPTVSATLVGISPSTYFDWMRKGANQQPGFLEFSESIKRACAQSIVNRVAHISRVADSGNWRAAAWMLERMAPESFGKNITKAPEAVGQRLDKPQAVAFQKLEDSLRRFLKDRNQRQSNSTIGSIQVNPTNTNKRKKEQ